MNKIMEPFWLFALGLLMVSSALLFGIAVVVVHLWVGYVGSVPLLAVATGILLGCLL